MQFLILLLLLSMVQGSPIDKSIDEETPVIESAVNKSQVSKPSLLKFGKIVNGINAKKGGYPYHAALVNKRMGYQCGASILSSRWILTAAHCIKSSNVDDYFILAGDHDITINDGETIHSVEKIIIHEKWDWKTNGNDIALLNLKDPICVKPGHVEFIKTLKPVDEVKVGEIATITGWGKRAWIGRRMRILQVAEIEIISSDYCKTVYYDYVEGNLCAGKYDGSKDACTSDSGGPMVVKRNGIFVQAGIVSYGFQCGLRGFPGVYTDLAYYYDWIQRHTV